MLRKRCGRDILSCPALRGTKQSLAGETKMTFKEQVAEARRLANVSVKQLADAIGVSESLVRKGMSGKPSDRLCGLVSAFCSTYRDTAAALGEAAQQALNGKPVLEIRTGQPAEPGDPKGELVGVVPVVDDTNHFEAAAAQDVALRTLNALAAEGSDRARKLERDEHIEFVRDAAAASRIVRLGVTTNETYRATLTRQALGRRRRVEWQDQLARLVANFMIVEEELAAGTNAVSFRGSSPRTAAAAHVWVSLVKYAEEQSLKDRSKYWAQQFKINGHRRGLAGFRPDWLERFLDDVAKAAKQGIEQVSR